MSMPPADSRFLPLAALARRNDSVSPSPVFLITAAKPPLLVQTGQKCTLPLPLFRQNCACQYYYTCSNTAYSDRRWHGRAEAHEAGNADYGGAVDAGGSVDT